MSSRRGGRWAWSWRDVVPLGAALAVHTILAWVSVAWETTPRSAALSSSPELEWRIVALPPRPLPDVPPAPPMAEHPIKPPPTKRPAATKPVPQLAPPPRADLVPPAPPPTPRAREAPGAEAAGEPGERVPGERVPGDAAAPARLDAPPAADTSKTLGPAPKPAQGPRLPKAAPSLLDRVVGGGAALPFRPNLQALEEGLDYRADGPVSDAVRAERRITQLLQEDLAQDAISAGLADDYFRVLRERIELLWRPAANELVDGGKQVEQLGFLRDSVGDPEALGELWRAYLDLAAGYARGEQPTLPTERRQALRELMRSRKGGFRFHAICEVRLTQDDQGNLLTLEMLLASGHPQIDEGVRRSVAAALGGMELSPPARLARGRPFQSRWRLRATWKMVPPTALLTGSGFDINQNGLEIDVPFQIKLSTHVTLQGYDNHSTRVPPAR